MKVGSLIELVRDDWNPYIKVSNIRIGVVYPVKGKIYTVREIRTSKEGPYIFLEEIVNPVSNYGGEITEFGWDMSRFKELLPPMTISVEELLYQEV